MQAEESAVAQQPVAGPSAVISAGDDSSNGTLPQAGDNKVEGGAVENEAAGEDTDMSEQLPEGASEVLYINNLNEKIKLDGVFQFFISRSGSARANSFL